MNPASGLCLFAQPTNGYQLQVQPCNPSDVNQQLSVYDSGVPFVSLAADKWVDVSGDDNGGPGAAVDVWDCQLTATDQNWIYSTDSTLRTGDLCVSINTAQGIAGTGTGAAGNHVALWTCNGSGIEQWQRSGGVFLNQASGLCLNDLNGTDTSGWQLDVQKCSGAVDQLFV